MHRQQTEVPWKVVADTFKDIYNNKKVFDSWTREDDRRDDQQQRVEEIVKKLAMAAHEGNI
jgi:hypothetical protein